MASTYSTNLKIELIGSGEQAGTWGTTTNTNLGTTLEEAITGIATADFPSDADLTLAFNDVNTTQVFRNLVLSVTSTGSLTTTRNLIVPTIEKQYYIWNGTTGGQSIVVKTVSGTGVTVPNGAKMLVFADGTNVVEGLTRINGTDIPSGATLSTASSTETLTNKSIDFASNTLTGTLAEFNTAVSDATLASLTGTETLTNKTIDLASNTLTGTTAEFNTALSDGSFATLAGTETLTNKTISLASNTVTGTTAEFNTALSDGAFATLAGTETLTNKTLSAPSGIIAGDIGYTNTTSGLTATNVQAALDEVVSDISGVQTIPTGFIGLWSGSTASIPSGWALCDGTNGTPDLRDRFVVGAGNSYAVDATGGSKDAVVVSHDHSFSATTTSAGSHNHSGSTSTAGSHSHTINEGVGSGTVSPGGTFAWVGLQSRSTNSAGNHSHSLSINSAGAHTHSVSGTTGSSGVSGTDQNLPPYYALAYIMKL